MSHRVQQLNELFKQELANLIIREMRMEDVLITLAYVDCSPDLQHAKIGISVLPDNRGGSAVKALKQRSGLFAKILKKKLKLHHIPKFHWIIDETEKKAAELDKIFNEIQDK